MAEEIIEIVEEVEDIIEVVEETATLPPSAPGEATDSQGTVLTVVPAGQQVPIADSVVRINTIQVAQARATQNTDLEVVGGDGLPRGSFVGGKWLAEGGLEVNVQMFEDIEMTTETSMVEFGQTVYLRITTSGGTPTEHTFWLPRQDGTSYLKLTQAGNTYAWEVDVFGDFTIEAMSCNPTQSGSDHTGLEFSSQGKILDILSSDPKWAIGTRVLSAAYANLPILNIRRSNDNAVADFTAAELTNGTLTTWVGAGNDGLVTIAYDQSGNGNHRYQTSAAWQHKIVSAGTLLTDSNGNPAIHGVGQESPLLPPGASGNGLTGADGALFTVAKMNKTTQPWRSVGGRGGYNGFRALSENPMYSALSAGDVYHNGLLVATNLIAATDTESILNGIDINWATNANWNTAGYYIGDFAYMATSGFWCENIVFDTFDGLERETLEAEQNAYYNYY